MTDFMNVESDSTVPASSGLVLGIAPLPSGNSKHPVPMKVYAAQIGDFGSGNPVSKLQVQLTEGGTWMDVVGATITDNNSLSAYCYGVAARLLIPTLTTPGTGATAPRVFFTATNLFQSSVGGRSNHIVALGNLFSNDLGTTSEVLSCPGAGRSSPDAVPPLGVPMKSLLFLTVEGAGTGFIESTFVDGDGTFEIKEGASAVTNQQVAVESFADEHHVDFTDGAGTTDVWLDAFSIAI